MNFIKSCYRFIGFFGILLPTCSVAQKAIDIENWVKAKTDTAFAKGTVPGIFIVYGNGNINGHYATGYALPDDKKGFDMKTFFEIGSITKTFTAYILTSVLKDHQIADSSAILPYLPASVQKNEQLSAIRFVQLMNHSSGFPRLPENLDLTTMTLQPYETYDSNELFTYLQTAKLNKAGSYEYSNLAAGLAGVLAERISGKSYAALLDQYIFLPFNMVDKNNTIEKSNNKSQGYFDDNTAAEYWNMNVLAPAGGLKCTGEEMKQYLLAMSKPVNKYAEAIMQELTTPTFTLNPVLQVGRGWHISKRKDMPEVYWHNGGTYGFSTFCAFVKGTGQYVLVVVNKFNSNAISDKLGMNIIHKILE